LLAVGVGDGVEPGAEDDGVADACGAAVGAAAAVDVGTAPPLSVVPRPDPVGPAAGLLGSPGSP
jgi:hypothetical protein